MAYGYWTSGGGWAGNIRLLKETAIRNIEGEISLDDAMPFYQDEILRNWGILYILHIKSCYGIVSRF